jgi:DNA-binding IclR family transcriptional regulator
MTLSATEMETLATRVKTEYVEMPGLSLTLPQAQRLLGLDGLICERLLSELVASGFLVNTSGGRFQLAGRSVVWSH